jgi:hypothetical protein
VITTGDEALVGRTELMADGEEVSIFVSFKDLLHAGGSYGLARFFTVTDFCAGFRSAPTGEPFQSGEDAEGLRE